MSILISHSSDNIGRTEAQLLLYLLDELPADERAAVEQLMAGDAGAREMFEQLRAANDAIGLGLKQADAMSPMGNFELASIARRTARQMSQQQVERLVRPAIATPARRWRPSMQMVGTAAASIAILAGLFIWWGNHADPALLSAVPSGGDAVTNDDGGSNSDTAGGSDRDAARRDSRSGQDGGRGWGWGNSTADAAALSAADSLSSAFDTPTISVHVKNLADAETQFDRLREVSELGRSDTATMTSR